MRRVLFLLAAIFVFVSTVLAEETKIEIRITGYKTGEFAVKGEIAKQLERDVINPLRKRLSKEKVDLEIAVIGCADKTGISAENDRLGKSRADEIKLVLSGEFPDARIIAITKGDELDSKMVKIRLRIKPFIPVSKNTPLNPGLDFDKYFLWGGLSFIMLVLSVLLFFWLCLYFKRSGQTNKISEEISKPIVFKEITQWVEVPNGAKVYLVPVTKKANGTWYSPIPNSGHTNQFLFKDKKTDLGNILRSCMKETRISFYEPIFEELVQKGIIKIKKIDGGAAL
jgi:hypothetical protein